MAFVSFHSHERVAAASEWLASRPKGSPCIVVGCSLDAVNALVRRTLRQVDAEMGWERTTFRQLVARLALPALAQSGAVPAPALALQAVAARVAEGVAPGRFAGIEGLRGFAIALQRTLDELRLAEVSAQALRAHDPSLAEFLEAYDQALRDEGLADTATMLRWARDHVEDAGCPPVLFLDVPLRTSLETTLYEAIRAAQHKCLATVPASDRATLAALDLGRPRRKGSRSALEHLQQNLFADTIKPVDSDPSVTIGAAPGEARECVEVARRIHALNREGVPYDSIAIALRSPEHYRAALTDALNRARIPTYFARGTRLPDPAGRALLSLLRCASEGLSASAFAEYLSLGEVPEETTTPALVSGDDDALAQRHTDHLDPDAAAAARIDEIDDASAIVDGTLRTPRRWENILVDAAVIGGRDRWNRRLSGLQGQLEAELRELSDDEGGADRHRQRIEEIQGLRSFALPILDRLTSLPEGSDWGGWLTHLEALVNAAIRRPERLLRILADLRPLAAVGPVHLADVRRVLEPRLTDLIYRPANRPEGRVVVADVETLRGQSFPVVFMPGLGERMFPPRILEDPILLDEQRAAISPALIRNAHRGELERERLSVAVGTASERLFVSFPTIDLARDRPRVPSIYALDIVRALQGQIPPVEALVRDSLAESAAARLGWPAPREREQAIDDAEFDLVALHDALDAPRDQAQGSARYLVEVNPHLRRAFELRWMRGARSWQRSDGLSRVSDPCRAELESHAPNARPYSASALQNLSSCPYRFFLSTIHRLAPREVPESIEQMPPLARGSLIHDVQFRLLRRLTGRWKTESFAPLAHRSLDEVLDEVASRWEDELAPAIPRIWRDEVEAIRTDLHAWLELRLAEPQWEPHRYELAFGLKGRDDRDPHSTPDPVQIAGGLTFRGSIDLVEKNGTQRRVTDHKTGRALRTKRFVIDGGRTLQPVLYALALEKLEPESEVVSGRLDFCTSRGSFQQRETPLTDDARAAAELVTESVREAVQRGELPAAPSRGACTYCDYQPICGAHEELRTQHKPPIDYLDRLRGAR